MPSLTRLLTLAIAGLILAGCYVQPGPAPGPVRPARPYAEYVPGHYGPNGFWIPGHYR